MPDLLLTNTLASYGTLVLLVATALILAILAYARIPDSLSRPLARYGLLAAFFVTTLASAVTLYYSEVLGQAPCSLCWLQRVFLYPQAFLFGIAYLKSDARITVYTTALSIVGALIALYHHAIQLGASAPVPCAAAGPSCTEVLFLTWGFVSFPFMAFALFLFLIVFSVLLETLWRKFPPARVV